MARTEARIFVSIWKDEDFLALPPTAQRMYMFLLSQEDLAYCGVIPLRVPRWARKARSLTPAEIETDLRLLTAGPRPFLVIDEDTGELFVRSLIRHDQVWKQPNIMKGARESASLIESPMIRAVLLNELLRIPVQESSSALVKAVHAEFVNDLRKGSGNPSPNPSRKGKPNPSGNHGGNASATPSQGEGDGYGLALKASPSPSSPPARATAQADRPLIPFAVPSANPEEGRGDLHLGRTPEAVSALVAEIRAIRPDWSTRSVRRSLDAEAVIERPWPRVRAAALAVAADSETEHPGRLAHDGPWWREAAPAQSATVRAAPEWCRVCGPNRRLEDPRTKDDLGPCPVCHPSMQGRSA